ncbi:MAG: energy-coupling factor ABC transporter permease [Acidimicrobiales bacterium]
MHIPDGWVDLPTSAAAGALAATAVAVAGRRAGARLKERATTLPAVLAAYLLVAQLPALPLGVGTSAHLVGTGLATALVGPSTAIVCVATVVVVQALVLADGGVTAIGLNLLANGVAPALAAAAVLAVWRAGPSRTGNRRLPLVAGVAAGLATMAAAATTGAELAVGGTDVIPAGTVAAVVGGAHLVVAIGEGLLTAAVVSVVARLRPDLVLPPPTPTSRHEVVGQ